MSPTAVTKPVLPPLQTPRSASFPSEICSTPISACLSAVIKQEHDLRTPITPPTAYTDFLKALTPRLASPPPSALNRSMSDDSTVSKDTQNTESSTGSSFSGGSRSNTDTFKSPTYPPPTPNSACSTTRRSLSGLKRLRIPQQHSPIFSPSTAGPSPRTAMSGVQSALYSPFSPAEWNPSRIFETIQTPRSACSKSVSVRSVVTRTVTYKRTTPNLEPAPRGKRRKTASSAASSVRSTTADLSSDDESEKKKMPPPLVSIKESTPEEEQALKLEPKSIVPAIIPATAAEA